MIVVKQIAAAAVPIPQVGKARVFLDTDNEYKVKKDDGSVVSLEEAALGISDAESVNYVTNDTDFWLWSVSVPPNVELALDYLAAEIRDINQILDALAPQPASNLGVLTLSESVTYQAKVAAGLPTVWYTQVAPGAIINTAIYDNTFRLGAPNFRSGRKDTPSSYGSLSSVIDDVVVDTYNMTSGPGTSGDLTVLSIVPHENFWAKANASLAVNQLTEGYKKYQLRHTEAQDSTPFEAYYDDNTDQPAFSSPVTVVEVTKVSKWLSGIEYYGLGSAFDVSYTIQDLFKKVYSVSGATSITCTGMNQVNMDPVTPPQWTDPFVVTNRRVTLDKQDECDLDPNMVVVATKPNNNNAATNQFPIKTNLGFGISTYGTVSTNIAEYFHDEAQRLVVGTTTAFNSQTPLPNGEAQVRCGSLIYGEQDYPAKSGDQVYERYFVKPTANSGRLTFVGLDPSNISPYGTGQLNIILQLDNEGIFFDLGRPFGDNAGDGSSISTALGARVSATSTYANFSFGTFTTANNLSRYRVKIIFKGNTYMLSSIITT